MSIDLRYNLIFFTGAGISAESGVPTFSDQEGLRDKLTRSFALSHPEEYRETIEQMRRITDAAEPNAAHLAIADMNVPVITMNIDGLHRRAGTHSLYEIHGRLPEDHELYASNFNLLQNIPVLYGDPAPMYAKAKRLVESLEYGNSYFVIVGVSFYTIISEQLLKIAKRRKARIIIINDNAATKIPKLCDQYKFENRMFLPEDASEDTVL